MTTTSKSKCPFHHTAGEGAENRDFGPASFASICCISTPRSPIQWGQTSITVMHSASSIWRR